MLEKETPVAAPDPIGGVPSAKLLATMAMTKSVWGRFDSWIGRAVFDKLWAKREWFLGQVLSTIYASPRQINVYALSCKYGATPDCFVRKDFHIVPSTGEFTQTSDISPLLKIKGEYVWLHYDVNNSICRFLVRPSAREEIAEVLAYEMATMRSRAMATTRKYRVDLRTGGSRFQEWYNITSTSLRTKLDQLPIHSSLRPELNRIVSDLENSWWNHDGKTRVQMFEDRGKSLNLLLHGPRGSGKTSIAYALSQELEVASYKFPHTELSEDFWTLCELIESQSVVIADEADTKVFTGKETPAIDIRNAGSLPMAVEDTLAYLTGPQQPSGILTVICTNRPQDFDPRVTREGRIHTSLCVDKVDHDGLVYWFEKNHPDCDITGLVFQPVLMTRIFTLIRKLKLPELVAQELTKEQTDA